MYVHYARLYESIISCSTCIKCVFFGSPLSLQKTYDIISVSVTSGANFMWQ